jgi:hypothetical protein
MLPILPQNRHIRQVAKGLFLIVNDADRTNISVEQTAATAQTNVIGHSAFTTYSPGTTYNIVKPGEALIIPDKLLRLARGQHETLRIQLVLG